MSGSQIQQPVPNNQVFHIALEAQEWQTVFTALNEMPMRISRPVFDKIYAQIQQSLERNQQPIDPNMPTQLRRANGEDHQRDLLRE